MSEQRRRQVLRDYAGPDYVVHWQPGLCIHSANCVRRLPRVFDPARRPWIELDGAVKEDVADAVGRCPTGALSIEYTDGTPGSADLEPAVVMAVADGPLYVTGTIEVVDAAGNTLRRATRVALCRCGASGNKPYCDNSHLESGFRT